VHQVGHWLKLYLDARSAKHQNSFIPFVYLLTGTKHQ